LGPSAVLLFHDTLMTSNLDLGKLVIYLFLLHTIRNRIMDHILGRCRRVRRLFLPIVVPGPHMSDFTEFWPRPWEIVLRWCYSGWLHHAMMRDVTDLHIRTYSLTETFVDALNSCSRLTHFEIHIHPQARSGVLPQMERLLSSNSSPDMVIVHVECSGAARRVDASTMG
jgi:hypothetical protein